MKGMNMSIEENHKSSCTALKTLFRGWGASIEFLSGDTAYGIAEELENGQLGLNGEPITEANPIVYYKPIRVS